MTTIKEFLYQVRHEQREIENLQDRIEQIRTSLLPAGIAYDKDRVQSSPSDSMPDRIASCVDLERTLTENIARLVTRHKAAYNVIGVLEDSNERQVLQMYFLELGRITMEDVASRMDYSVDSCWKFYYRAFDHLDHVDGSAIISRSLQEITD